MIPARQPEGPYLSFRSNASGRHATVEDDGYSAWLYLTRQTKYEVVVTVFVYSRVELPEFKVMPFGKNGPPLLLRQFGTAVAVQKQVPEAALRIKFSHDGNAAVVFLRGEPWAFVVYDQMRGHSKSISKSGPFGMPWDEQLFREYFPDLDAANL